MENKEAFVPLKYQSRFWRTKEYLFQIRNGKRKVSLLERRIAMRENAEPTSPDIVPVSDLQMQLFAAQEELKFVTMVVTDMVGMLEDVNQQMVITKRYLDGETWEQIAVDMDMALRSVHKLHGQALPILELMLFDNENGADADSDNENDQNEAE